MPDNTLVASFELPGSKKEHVNIEVSNSCLTVSGESQVCVLYLSVVTVNSSQAFAPLPEGITVKHTFSSTSTSQGTVVLTIIHYGQSESVKASMVDDVLTFPQASVAACTSIAIP